MDIATGGCSGGNCAREGDCGLQKELFLGLFRVVILHIEHDMQKNGPRALVLELCIDHMSGKYVKAK